MNDLDEAVVFKEATMQLDAQEFGKLLLDVRACGEAREWAAGKTFAEVWSTCQRGDWMLWLAGRMADKTGWPTRQQVVLAACTCAETALKFVKPGEDRPRLAIETARKWAQGEATIQEVRKAYAAADAYADAAAYAAAYAAYAAAYAAYAAAYAAEADADAYAAYAAEADAAAAAYAAYAAAYAAAAAYADAAAAAAAARANALAECADLVRKELPLHQNDGVLCNPK